MNSGSDIVLSVGLHKIINHWCTCIAAFAIAYTKDWSTNSRKYYYWSRWFCCCHNRSTHKFGKTNAHGYQPKTLEISKVRLKVIFFSYAEGPETRLIFSWILPIISFNDYWNSNQYLFIYEMYSSNIRILWNGAYFWDHFDLVRAFLSSNLPHLFVAPFSKEYGYH